MAKDTVMSRLLYCILTCVVAYHGVKCLASVAPFTEPPFDGPYQLFNALRRIDAGQYPVRDFPAFHGPATSVVHFPFYKLIGNDIIASELSRQFMSRFLAIIVFILISIRMTGKLWPACVWLVWTLHNSVPWLTQWTLFNSFEISPSNSLYSFRTLLAMMCIPFCASVYEGRRSAIVMLAFLIAATILVSVEQGFAVIMAIMSTWILVMLLGNTSIRRFAVNMLVTILLTGALSLLALFLVTKGDMHGVAQFYLKDLPADQVWYFGSPPCRFFGDGKVFTHNILAQVLILLGLHLMGWMRELRKFRSCAVMPQRAIYFAMACGFAYGIFSLISNLGIAGYTLASCRMLILLYTIIFCRRLTTRLKFSKFLSYAVILVGSCLTIQAGLQVKSIGFNGEKEADYKRVMERITQDVRPVTSSDLWSTYAGELEARLGIFHPHTDYIIHALGQKRQEYVTEFESIKPAYVQTGRRDQFYFEEWLQNCSWSFYNLVINNYTIVDRTEETFIWKRNTGSWISGMPASSIQVPSNQLMVNQSITLPVNTEEFNLVVVHVKYSVTNPLKLLPLIGQQGRILVTASDSLSKTPVSLPPMANDQVFPIIVKKGTTPSIRFDVHGFAPGVQLSIQEITLHPKSIGGANLDFLGNP